MPNPTDRTVHATLPDKDAEVVRYDRAGKWYLEPRDPELRSRKRRRIGLQFSVHESTDDARDALVPFKAKLTLAQMAETGVQWAERTGRRPFFNYWRPRVQRHRCRRGPSA